MKRQKLSFTLFLCVAACFTPFVASAYTIVSTGPSATPINDYQNSSVATSSMAVAVGGTPNTVLLYVQALSSANPNTNFFVDVIDDDAGVFPVHACSATSTIASLGIPTFSSFVAGQGAPRYFLLGASAVGVCQNVPAGHHLTISIRSPGDFVAFDGNTITTHSDIFGFTPWMLVSTDTGTSTIYQYQDTIVAVATTSNALFCNNQYPGTDFGQYMGFALCSVSGYLFIPNQQAIAQFQTLQSQLGGKFPFAWVSDSQSVLNSLSASSTGNYVNLNINFGSSTQALGFTNLDVVSTTTLSRYMPDSARNGFKALIATGFYLAAAMFIYRSVMRIWNHNNA